MHRHAPAHRPPDLALGSGRLIGSGDWSNVTKTFNLARATVTRNGFKMDIFAGSVVAIDAARMDRAKPGAKLLWQPCDLGQDPSGSHLRAIRFREDCAEGEEQEGRNLQPGNGLFHR